MGTSAKRDSRSAEIAERQRQALEMRKAGATYEQIAKALKFADRSNVRKAVQSALQAIIKEPAEEVLQLELQRLDAMIVGLWAKAKTGDGQAVDRVLRIMERRAGYLGLDAPKRVEQTNIEASATPHEELLSRLAGIASTVGAGGVPSPTDGEAEAGVAPLLGLLGKG